jgi:hypothetical protein
MVLRLKTTVVLGVFLLAALSVPGNAQLGPTRAAGALGLLTFEGTRGESGIGIAAAGQVTFSVSTERRFAIEAGVHTLTDFFLLVPPPASPVWHARVLASTRVVRAAPVYLTVGLGAYGPVGPADRADALALGLDVGLGVRFSRHAAVEIRYLNLRTTRFLGWAVPVSLVLGI